MIVSELMNEDLKPVIDILFYKNDSSTYAEYAKINNNKIGSYKPLSLEAIEFLIKELKKENKNEELKFKDIIPSNVLHFDNDMLNPYIIWFCKSSKNQFIYLNGKGVLHYPHLIFKLYNSQLYVYCTKTSNIKIDTELYKAPFPNCYADGKICMGTVNVSDYITGNLNKIIENMQTIFFSSKFTSELMSENRSVSNTHNILKRIINKDIPYPKKELVKHNFKLKNVLR